MKVNGRSMRTIWVAPHSKRVEVIDQTKLPHALLTQTLSTLEEAADAIRTMIVRGAPLIGVTAAYGVCLALEDDASDASLDAAVATLTATRPTAINLAWALRSMREHLRAVAPASRPALAWQLAERLAEADVAANDAIGRHGAVLLDRLAQRKAAGSVLNVLTHCNAGWLATVDHGTALAPVYRAHDAGLKVHVWVDETRPRNQGASLTAWELGAHGVPHTLLADNAGGHFMQQGLVDCVLVGSDRTTASGDVANKIGTYLKALAAFDNRVPFYVALPSSTIDWSIERGEEIPIEERDAREVSSVQGRTESGVVVTVDLAPQGTRARNPAFDVTPARLVTALITERGVCEASRQGLERLFCDT